ncbi:MAG: SsrA-binding protein, partial [Bdellovibrionales bacterium]|nr:SsrA-binding protein [Bdellovibrionales bacterium]
MGKQKKKAVKKEGSDDIVSGSVVENRKARFSYEVLETFEAGLVLTGNEIKSIRAGNITLNEAFIRPRNGELWLVQAHIS